MTAVRQGSAEYERMFAGFDPTSSFVTDPSAPDYARLTNGYLNPAIQNLFENPAIMQAGQAQDIRNGMRLVVGDLVVDLGDGAPINLPTALVTGATQIVQSAGVGSSLDAQQVGTLFATVASGNPKKIAGALLGTALGALALSFPVVGWIGSAIIGLAVGIVSIFNKRDNDAIKDAKKRFDALYSVLPPLQTADTELDADIIEVLLRPKLRTRDVTDIWRPQFDADIWVGAERKGGFAFAPGVPESAEPSEENGFAEDVFIPSGGGLGCIPGTPEVTAIVQVSLQWKEGEPGHTPFTNFRNGVGPDPRGQVSTPAGVVRGWSRVKDTGMYLPATGRLAGSLWDMFTATHATALGLTPQDRARMRVDGNPLRYRIDIIRLHEAWRRWATGGIEFIRERCYPWYQQFVSGAGTFSDSDDLEGYFGTAVFYATGVWGGIVSGGSSTHPTYAQYPEPNGFSGPQLAAEAKAYGWPGSSVSSSYSGAFLPITDPSRWPDELMHDRYHRGPAGVSIKGTLDSARQWQEWELGHTLVSAYVSAADAAFVGDEKLLDRLWRLRATLLQHGDRMAIDMRDVPADELGVPDLPHSDSWREQLLAAGVPEQPSQALPGGGFKLPGGGGKPPSYCEAGIECDAPAPAPRPPFQPIPANPWEPGVLALKGVSVKPKRSSGGFALAAFAGAAAVSLGAALVAAQERDKRPSRSFSAGGLP